MKLNISILLILLFIISNSCVQKQKCNDEYAWLNPNLPVDVRVSELLAALSIDEKISLLIETSHAIERLNVPAYSYGNEALHGLVRPGKATVFPQAIALGATFNPELIKLMSTYISDEARAKYNDSNGQVNLISTSGTLTAWSPTINMARDPRWGRTAETYGEDPFLSSKLGIAFVEGLQGDDPRNIKMAAAPKHFVANNEDDNRFSCKAEIPERWLHDYYLNAFRNVVIEAKPLSIMSAYNAINGIPCTANKWLLTDQLRDSWGFNGFVVSDCGAISNLYDKHKYVNSLEEAVAAALDAGCDLECGGWCTYPYVYLNNAKSALEKGFIEEAKIDTAVARILKGRFLLGLFDPMESSPYSDITKEVIGCEKHQELVLKLSRQSMVLLKNEKLGEDKLLPINQDKIKTIAVVGPNADVLQFGDYSGVPMNEAITPMQGIINKVGGEIDIEPVTWIHQGNGSNPIAKEYFYMDHSCSKKGLHAEYFQNSNLRGKASAIRTDLQLNFDWTNLPPDPDVSTGEFSVRWNTYLKVDVTGKYKFNLDVSDGVRMFIDGKIVLDHWSEKEQKRIGDDSQSKLWDMKYYQNSRADTCSAWFEAGRTYPIKVEYFHQSGNAKAILNWDIPLIEEKKRFLPEINAAENSDLVIAVLGLGNHIEKEGKDKKNIDLPDDQIQLIRKLEKVNKNIVVVLVNGSPVNLTELDKNIPAILEAWYPGEQGGNAIADILFGEYCPSGRLPVTFYSNEKQLLPMNDYDISKGRTYMFLKEKPLYPFGFGLSYTDFKYRGLEVENNTNEALIKVQFEIENIGDFDADELAQVYIRNLDSEYVQPIKQLKAFKRIHLKKGEEQKVQLTISYDELKFWDVKNDLFIFEEGEYEIMLGASSEDIKLRKILYL